MNDALRTVDKHGIHVTIRANVVRLDKKGSTFVHRFRKYGTQAVEHIEVYAVEQKLRQNLLIRQPPGFIGSPESTN